MDQRITTKFMRNNGRSKLLTFHNNYMLQKISKQILALKDSLARFILNEGKKEKKKYVTEPLRKGFNSMNDL